MTEIISPSINEWSQFVENLPYYSFSYLPAWAQAHEKTFPGYKLATNLYILGDGTNVLIPMVERCHDRLIFESMPCGLYGGILCNEQLDRDQINSIITHILNPKAIYVSIYPGPILSGGNYYLRFLNKRFKSFDSFASVIKLEENYENIWKYKINKKNRNQTRKAEKMDVSIREGNSVEDIESFFSLYIASAERWGLDSFYPLDFYNNLFKFGGSRVKLHLASKDGVDISGAIHLLGNKEIFYWRGAMLKDYSKFCPNNLLFNRVIEYACEKGFEYYNMAGSGGLEGVESFKRSFGAERINYKYYLHKNQFLMRLFRKMKLVLNRT